MYKCKNCGKEYKAPRYYWENVSGEYCSEKCAIEGSPIELIKDDL
jgi:hypothetical protein